jgi:hypothetical protein
MTDRSYLMVSIGGVMAAPDVAKKTCIYLAIARLNRSFENIAMQCEVLQQSGVFKPKYRRLYQSFTQELQGELNSEVLSTLHDVELDDWNRFGRVRDKWEKYLRGEETRPAKKEKP